MTDTTKETERPLDPSFEHIKTLIESSHLDVTVSQCPNCGQKYAGYHAEYYVDGDDDHWDFWVPVSEKDILELARNFAIINEFINTRPHITKHPLGSVYWTDHEEMLIPYHRKAPP